MADKRRDSRRRNGARRSHADSGVRRSYAEADARRGYPESGGRRERSDTRARRNPPGVRTRRETAGRSEGRRLDSRRNPPDRAGRRVKSPGPRTAARKRRRRRAVFLLIALLAVLLFTGSYFLFDPPEQKTDITAPTLLQPPALLHTRTLNPPSPLETRQPETPPEPEEPEEPPEAPAMRDADAVSRHKRRKKDFYTFLLAGVDDGNGGSDTMIFVSMDTQNNAIHGVSLPRDLKAVINGHEWKLNAAYNIGGMSKLAETVSWQLGIPVDYTVEVDLKGFAALVDAIGGVDFEVPIDMNYDDPAQDLLIQFQAGMQHLTGEQALGVVRFRHNWDGTGYGDEDLGRMRTQQNFLKTVAKQLLTPANVKNLSKFAKIFQTYVKTDLTVRNLAWLGKEAISIGADGVDFTTLPGTWKIPYIYADRKAALELVNQRLNPYEEDRTADDLHLAR